MQLLAKILEALGVLALCGGPVVIVSCLGALWIARRRAVATDQK